MQTVVNLREVPINYVGPIKIDRLTRFYKKISLQEYPYFDIALIKLQYIYLFIYVSMPNDYFIEEHSLFQKLLSCLK